MRAQFETLRAGAGRGAGTARDPFALSPDRSAEPAGPAAARRRPPGAPRGGRGWTAPFVMAPYNTRIVRRSNALLDFAYGRKLRYGEVMGIGRGPLGAVARRRSHRRDGRAARPPCGRRRCARCWTGCCPRPVAGRATQTREKGWFRMEVDAGTESGRRYRAGGRRSG